MIFVANIDIPMTFFVTLILSIGSLFGVWILSQYTEN